MLIGWGQNDFDFDYTQPSLKDRHTKYVRNIKISELLNGN
jgi:hypothetical protein